MFGQNTLLGGCIGFKYPQLLILVTYLWVHEPINLFRLSRKISSKYIYTNIIASAQLVTHEFVLWLMFSEYVIQ